jgi:hypothetical protein
MTLLFSPVTLLMQASVDNVSHAEAHPLPYVDGTKEAEVTGDDLSVPGCDPDGAKAAEATGDDLSLPDCD